MHKLELTELERKGLIAHSLPVNSPCQLSDAFRLGVAWALKGAEDAVEEVSDTIEKSEIKVGDKVKIIGGVSETEHCWWDDGMDKYLGEVSFVLVAGNFIELEGIEGWYFAPEWLEVVA